MQLRLSVRNAGGICSLLLVALVIFGSALSPSVNGYSSGEASSMVAEAEAAVGQAFKAVLEAEVAGASVAASLARLNEAGGLLAEAEMALRNGDFTLAAEKADQCSGIAHSVLEDASALKSSALADAQAALTHMILFSLVSAVALVAALILVWALFRRSYLVRMLKMKPEVESDAEAQ